MRPSAPFPNVNSPSILSPSYPSYTKLIARATSLLNPSVTLCLACPPPLLISWNSTLYLVSASWNFDTSFPVSSYQSCRQCSSSSLVVLILQVTQCLPSMVSYSSLHHFCMLPSILYHLAFVSFCLLAFLTDGHPCLWVSLPPGTPQYSYGYHLFSLTFFPFFPFLFSCQNALTIRLYLSSWVSKNYPVKWYQNRTSASNSLLMRLYKIQTSCATVALTCTMHYYRTHTLHYLSDPNSNQL